MNKLQRLILLSVFAFLPLFLNSCVTTILIGTVLMIDHVCFHTESDGGTCGEIVYRIDFTHPDETWMTEKRIAQALRLPKTLAPGFYDSHQEWRGKRSFRHIRLDREIEAEGQYLVREGFDAPFADPGGRMKVELSVFPSDRCMFVAYKWDEPKETPRPDEAAMNACNDVIVRLLEQDGFSVNKVAQLNADVGTITKNKTLLTSYDWYEDDVHDSCISFEDAGHNVPSEMELKAMLDREFFITTALNIDVKWLKYRFFWMLDRFRNVLFIYHIKDKKLRVISLYRDNTENARIVERLLKENGYSILDVNERTYDASPSDHGEILFSRPWIGDPYHPESVTYVIYHIPADVYEMEYESIIPLDP